MIVCILYTPMKRVNYHLTDLQIKKLNEISDNTGISIAELIRRAIDDYLKKQSRKG